MIDFTNVGWVLGVGSRSLDWFLNTTLMLNNKQLSYLGEQCHRSKDAHDLRLVPLGRGNGSWVKARRTLFGMTVVSMMGMLALRPFLCDVEKVCTSITCCFSSLIPLCLTQKKKDSMNMEHGTALLFSFSICFCHCLSYSQCSEFNVLN